MNILNRKVLIGSIAIIFMAIISINGFSQEKVFKLTWESLLLSIPKKQIVIKTLSLESKYNIPVEKISLVGSNAKIKWEQTFDGLVIQIPEKLSCAHA